MFLDLLDTIKTSESQYDMNECKKNAVQGESMLFYLLLSGKVPVLTQTQVMDSKIIHNILFNKGMNEYFLKLIKSGKIKLALYTGQGQLKSLQDYFIHSLRYGLDGQTDFFDFSTLPFLKHYDIQVRKNLNKKIIDVLQHNSYQFATDGVSREHVEYIEAIIDNIQNIDRYIRGNYIYTDGYKKSLDTLVATHCQIFLNDASENSGLVKLCRGVLEKGNSRNRRSAYYSFLESMKNEYSIENIQKVKQIIDNCYNEAVASSLPSEEYNLNFSSKFVDLIKPILMRSEISKKEVIKLRTNHKDNVITWETLVAMLSEVDNLQNEKNLNRTDALMEYKRRQKFKPVVAVAKYLGFSVLPSFIPAAPEAIEIVTDLVTGAATEVTDSLFKKPSLKFVGNTLNESKMTTNLVDPTIEFISMTLPS